MSWKVEKAEPEPEDEAMAVRYRRSQVLGLLLIAGVILAVTLLRAERGMLFPPGWWRF
ncbi:MAG TPA: hypothetical protein VGD62_03230 [Acidobacteriaceae bacterium]